jgi:hypothetical protein
MTKSSFGLRATLPSRIWIYQRAVQDQEELVGVRVLVPGELTLNLHDPDVVVVIWAIFFGDQCSVKRVSITSTSPRPCPRDMQQGPAAVNDRTRVMLLLASTVHQPDSECCFGVSSALPARRWTSARWLSRWVRQDLVAVAAAVFLLDDVHRLRSGR